MFNKKKYTVELKSDTAVDQKQLESLIASAYTVKMVNDTNKTLNKQITALQATIQAKDQQINALKDRLNKLGQILGGK